MTTPISSRHRESSFLSVAHIWAEALKQWPKPVFVNPEPMTVESLIKKLREARTGKNLYGWQSATIQEARWKAFANEFTLHIEQGRIVIRNLHCKPEKVTKAGIVEDPAVITVEHWGIDFLHTICSLLHRHCLKPQPRFLIKDLDEEKVKYLEASYDVGFVATENPNEWMTI